jgi:phosphoglycerol transferase MdoB-like AlkP superfamily enzyme
LGIVIAVFATAFLWGLESYVYLINNLAFPHWVRFALFLQVLYVLCLYFLIGSLRRRVARVLGTLLWLLYVGAYLFIALYFINRHIPLDLGFLYFNRIVVFQTALIVLETLGNGTTLLFSFGSLAFLCVLGSIAPMVISKKLKRLLIAGLMISMLSNFAFPYTNSLMSFIRFNFFRSGTIKTLYKGYYEDFIEKKVAYSPKISSTASLNNSNVLIIKLESLNSVFVEMGYTPNMVTAAEQGYLFPHVYAPSVQTIRSNEVLLCGVPPSVGDTVYYTFSKESIEALECLPSVFNDMSYETHYFGTGPKNFDNQETYMTYMGFEYLHGKDIMGEDARVYAWGYKDDEYLAGVRDYLSARDTDTPFFGFVNLGITNHYPFYPLLEDVGDLELPYEDPEIFFEKIANTTFLQDHHLRDFLDYYFEGLHENTYLILVGDHPFPAGIHEGNIFNEKGAYEENFSTSAVIIPPRGAIFGESGNRVVEDVYSHLDIYSTLLAMSGVEEDYIKFSLGDVITDFAPGFSSFAPKERVMVSIQPFSGGYISLYAKNMKYLVGLLDDSISKFNLNEDPLEENPLFVNQSVFEELLRRYFLLE